MAFLAPVEGAPQFLLFSSPGETLGPPRGRSSSPLTARTASRMTSASKRRGDQRQRNMLSGSIFAFAALGCDA